MFLEAPSLCQVPQTCAVCANLSRKWPFLWLFFFNWETYYHHLSTTPVLPAAAFISAYEVS